MSIKDLGSPPSDCFVLSEEGKISTGKKTKTCIGVGIKSSGGRTSFAKVFSVDQGGQIGNNIHYPSATIAALLPKGSIKITSFDGDGHKTTMPIKGDEVQVKVGDIVHLKDGDSWCKYRLYRLFVGDYYGQPSAEVFSLGEKLQDGTGLYDEAFSDLGDDDDRHRHRPVLPTDYFEEEFSPTLQHHYFDGSKSSLGVEMEPDEDGIGLVIKTAADDSLVVSATSI